MLRFHKGNGKTHLCKDIVLIDFLNQFVVKSKQNSHFDF